jgi:hypothetical protein
MAPGTELGDPFNDRNLVIPRSFFVSSPKLFPQYGGVVYIALSNLPVTMRNGILCVLT